MTQLRKYNKWHEEIRCRKKATSANVSALMMKYENSANARFMHMPKCFANDSEKFLTWEEAYSHMKVCIPFRQRIEDTACQFNMEHIQGNDGRDVFKNRQLACMYWHAEYEYMEAFKRK